MDIADLAGQHLDAEEAAIRKAISDAAGSRELVPSGVCAFCGDPVEGARLFCHPGLETGCREDWEHANRLKLARGER